MEVDHIRKGKGKGKGKGKSNGEDKGKGTKPDNQDKDCYVCEKKGHFARDCWSGANQDKNSERSRRCKSGLRRGKRVCVCD